MQSRLQEEIKRATLISASVTAFETSAAALGVDATNLAESLMDGGIAVLLKIIHPDLTMEK